MLTDASPPPTYTTPTTHTPSSTAWCSSWWSAVRILASTIVPSTTNTWTRGIRERLLLQRMRCEKDSSFYQWLLVCHRHISHRMPIRTTFTHPKSGAKLKYIIKPVTYDHSQSVLRHHFFQRFWNSGGPQHYLSCSRGSFLGRVLGGFLSSKSRTSSSSSSSLLA